jgi:hypothetical protein
LLKIKKLFTNEFVRYRQAINAMGKATYLVAYFIQRDDYL